jgi:hypothetical protein
MPKRRIFRNAAGSRVTRTLAGHPVASGAYGGALPDALVRSIYDDFVDAYHTDGADGLPGMFEFDLMFRKLAAAHAAAPHDYRAMMYMKVLMILNQARNLHYANLRLENQVTWLKKIKEDDRAQITRLLEQIRQCGGKKEANVAISGDIGTATWKPKPFIYAQAAIDIYLAWYIYLYNTAEIEPRKFRNTIMYVCRMGDRAYDTLIDLLNERYEL